jgi:hypothetical protein
MSRNHSHRVTCTDASIACGDCKARQLVNIADIFASLCTKRKLKIKILQTILFFGTRGGIAPNAYCRRFGSLSASLL